MEELTKRGTDMATELHLELAGLDPALKNKGKIFGTVFPETKEDAQNLTEQEKKLINVVG